MNDLKVIVPYINIYINPSNFFVSEILTNKVVQMEISFFNVFKEALFIEN